MRNNLFYRIFIATLTLFISGSAFSQSDVSGLIKSGPADATILTQAYLKPLFKGFGVGLNTGWNNSAHSRNLMRFDLRIGLTGAVVPPNDENFDVTKIGLSNNVRPSNQAQTLTPTFAGGNSLNTQLTVYDSANQPIESFTMPKGTGFNLIPAPQLQGSIGLSRGIELSVRAMPKVNIGNSIGSVGMIGGGLKVELLPLISGMTDKLFPIDIAVAAAYTQFSFEIPLDVRVPSGAIPVSAGQVQDFSNQRIEAKFSGINAEAIISKRFSVFTPFLSLGYHNAKTDAGLMGNYPIVTGITPLGQKTYTNYANPVNINQTDINGLRTNIGFQLNLVFFRIYGSYTMAEYNAFNGGIGFGLGK
jgi:hypothetical protein